ncbi:outer membrane protein assembly factor BamE [Bacteroides sp.]|uniref:outer membrane protein assembly factor BamE domain-containing protein n=1 Tax=Bacteroides sp. TaxID=29523 RepID=UPI002639DC8E|nr:outer membrane protein assembly factor BamE [Bacteroides sp.]MDD3040602.1 outer membrane protein assembly factor BamE [Bacteroides sp.]
MRNIHAVLLFLVLILSSSCASYYVSGKKVMEVQKGMTQQEVRQLLGKPDYRRFEGDLEEWEFRRDKGTPLTPTPMTIIIQFMDGEVVSMDTFSGYGRPALPLPPAI